MKQFVLHTIMRVFLLLAIVLAVGELCQQYSDINQLDEIVMEQEGENSKEKESEEEIDKVFYHLEVIARQDLPDGASFFKKSMHWRRLYAIEVMTPPPKCLCKL